MGSQRVTLEKPLARPSFPILLYRRIELELRKATSNWRALPDFVIVGAQKSGTSSLHRYFCQHPSLLPAKIKEVHFFNGGLDPDWDKFTSGEALYRSYFPLRGTVRQYDALCFEASPDYLFNPIAIQRMRELMPEVKIIVLLRDPVERAISHYFHERRRGRETEEMGRAFALEDERLSRSIRERDFKDSHFINLSYKSRGLYAEQVRRLFEHYPREQVKVFEAEEFFEDPKSVMSNILEFLGLCDFPNLIDVKPIGVGKNRTNVPIEIRDHLSSYFHIPNLELVELLGRKFRWS